MCKIPLGGGRQCNTHTYKGSYKIFGRWEKTVLLIYIYINGGRGHARFRWEGGDGENSINELDCGMCMFRL